MGEETDRIIGLELGADDYVPKPFNPARTAGSHSGCAAARRFDASEHRANASSRNLQFAGWTLEPAGRRMINPGGDEVALTRVIRPPQVALVERANRVLTQDILLDLSARGPELARSTRAIDVTLIRPTARRKLEGDKRTTPSLSKTVGRSGGYVLAATVERAWGNAFWPRSRLRRAPRWSCWLVSSSFSRPDWQSMRS